MNGVSKKLAEQVKKLATMPETEIDCSDIPETTAEDWQNATRGRFYRSTKRENTNIVYLDDDVAAVFRNSKEVNDFLRPMCKLIQRQADMGATRGS